MGLPAKRTTSSKRDRRRSHHALSVVQTHTCTHCGFVVLAHRMCAHCHFYKGKLVVGEVVKTDRKTRKKEAKKRAQNESKIKTEKPNK